MGGIYRRNSSMFSLRFHQVIFEYFLQRSRSVFERALDVDHRSITIWLQYSEMEMRYGILMVDDHWSPSDASRSIMPVTSLIEQWLFFRGPLNSGSSIRTWRNWWRMYLEPDRSVLSYKLSTANFFFNICSWSLHPYRFYSLKRKCIIHCRCTSDGWNGILPNRHGSPISSSRSDTRR